MTPVYKIIQLSSEKIATFIIIARISNLTRMKIHKAESMKKEKKKNENIRIDKGKVKG
jgi:hypothetical protein